MTGALHGKRIVNTRAAHQAGPLDDALRGRGAVPLDYPCIEIIPPDDIIPLDEGLRGLAAGSFDWLVLTSANTVAALSARLARLGLLLPDAHVRTAAVGPATAEAASYMLGLQGITLPADYTAESLARALPIAPGERIFLPASALARPDLAAALTERGAVVQAVSAYQTVCGRGGVDVPGYLSRGEVDALTFTSPSTVNYFLERLRTAGGSAGQAYAIIAACIGPGTAAAARDAGFRTVIMPTEHTISGLADALDKAFSQISHHGDSQ
ncbi:MAG: uroporphyrinogen-III synthase [Pleurocapsa minor GSE-CHR-MK-17-07R]|jgi:uroporphyrinogen-III synthase|nr:uroporphyrinogen-III synthase [Pleurocapsa minor GSE-CHR-MK 17-07R]